VKIQTIPTVPGYYEFMALLRFAADPDALAGKLAELERVRSEINALIQGREDLSKIDALKAETEQLLASAKAERNAAAVESKGLVARSKADADKRALEWKAQRELQAAKLVERERAVQAREAATAAAAQAAEELSARASAELAKAQERLAAAEAIRAEFTAKAEQLRGLVA
jgi:hypothetical protein